MKVETTRFGTLEIQEDQIIDVPLGLIGFSNERQYALLEHRKGSPFFWFQSIDNGALAFVLVDPFLFKPDYEIQLSSEDVEALKLENGEGSLQGVQPMVIVNISKGDPKEITVNLLGPIVFNLPKRLAKQVVLYHHPYSQHYQIPLSQN